VVLKAEKADVAYGRSLWFVRYLIVDYTSALKKPSKNIVVRQGVPLDQRFRQLRRNKIACNLPS